MGVIGPILGAIVGVFVYNFVIGSYLVEKRVGEEMRKKLLDKEESESKDDETSLNRFSKSRIFSFFSFFFSLSPKENEKKGKEIN